MIGFYPRRRLVQTTGRGGLHDDQAIAANTKTLATVAKDIGQLTTKGMADDIGVPFHPGAAKFYKEAGITVQSH